MLTIILFFRQTEGPALLQPLVSAGREQLFWLRRSGLFIHFRLFRKIFTLDYPSEKYLLFIWHRQPMSWAHLRNFVALLNNKKGDKLIHCIPYDDATCPSVCDICEFVTQSSRSCNPHAVSQQWCCRSTKYFVLFSCIYHVQDVRAVWVCALCCWLSSPCCW